MSKIIISSKQPPFCEQKSLDNNAKIIEKGILLKEALGCDAKICCLVNLVRQLSPHNIFVNLRKC
jgi:hypothetical protein